MVLFEDWAFKAWLCCRDPTIMFSSIHSTGSLAEKTGAMTRKQVAGYSLERQMGAPVKTRRPRAGKCQADWQGFLRYCVERP